MSVMDSSSTATKSGSPSAPLATDWDVYYRRPFKPVTLTRKVTQSHLLRAMRRFVGPRPVVAELGGANSCFFDAIDATIRPREYHVLDNNQLGLEMMRQRIGDRPDVLLHRASVLDLPVQPKFDLVFSVGLIEHFSPADTARAIEAHFALTRPGGVVLMTFPTATWLYRAVRRVCEKIGLWIFHDERPLGFGEVAAVANRHGSLLDKRLVWPILLTQYHGIWRTPDAVALT